MLLIVVPSYYMKNRFHKIEYSKVLKKMSREKTAEKKIINETRKNLNVIWYI